ncbi:MAG: type I pullulanase [Treponema sp.]
MNIRLRRNAERKMAWTDKRSGYFEYSCTGCGGTDGYFRGQRRLFSGFSSDGTPLKEADYIDVRPEGFTAVFAGGLLNASLLLYEQAFYAYSAKSVGITGVEGITQCSADGRKTKAAESASFQSTNKGEDSRHIAWKREIIGGCTVVSSSAGFAAAADFSFHYIAHDDCIELVREQVSSSGADASGGAGSEPFSSAGWYIVFEDSQAAAVKKAARLAKENAIGAHCRTVSSFLERCAIDSGDRRFDEAFLWARFCGWMLGTKDSASGYTGIWAGLPWFRDNWGRDTFISLSGTLLASGCIAEAKDVLLGFAGFQDTDAKSPSYGRIPNRYRGADDVIYNTADGTLWFIRALWEYVQYSGDSGILSTLEKTLVTALDADIARTDAHGFLTHGDADSWMDARIQNKEALSPRGDRANDVQALWFTALRIGSLVTGMRGNDEKSKEYASLAAKVKTSFNSIFWNPVYDSMADCLPEGQYGEWAKDMKVRPNQLFALTVPSILPAGEENRLCSRQKKERILEDVERELVSPFGLFSLSPEDPLFHPEHENPALYHKDAAYHNGTIWQWQSGAYVSAAAEAQDTLGKQAAAIIQNEAKMILDCGCAGALSENIHAKPDAGGNPVLSGAFFQAWSLAEFVRNVFEDIAGFTPRLAEGKLDLRPHLPNGLDSFSAMLPFGRLWTLCVDIKRTANEYECAARWNAGEERSALPELRLNRERIIPNEKLTVKVDFDKKTLDCTESSFETDKAEIVRTGAAKFCCPAHWITDCFPAHDFAAEWCGSIRIKNYLENLTLSGRMKSRVSGGSNTAALEWLFDSKAFEDTYATNAELGALYGAEETLFRLWAPTARAVEVVLFADGGASLPQETFVMHKRAEKGFFGVWEARVKGDLHGVYYQFKVRAHGVTALSSDPYAKAAGVNGMRSMVADLARTNPEGWERVRLPALQSPSDAVIYEAHVADITSSPHWNGSQASRRTYLGAAESGTAFGGVPTGFDHIKSLGVTHVQFLPLFDFRSVDETKTHDAAYAQKPAFGLFNWGYDPQNYGLPEGSYSSNPYDGEVRIRELKTMIKAYADAGIGVVMDVVFNHVNDGLKHAFNLCVPGYYYRVDGFSGAGEDTASERAMVRRYIVDMLCYWLTEYKLCGFRFDLMGLHDVRTLNEARAALQKIKKDVLIYGEGWRMYEAGKMTPADMTNAALLNEIGFFNDAVRCGIKGSAFGDGEPGFIHDGSRREAVKFGIVGATEHPQVDCKKIEGTAAPFLWGKKTWLSVNYTEIHDNMTLNDKLILVEPDKDDAYYEQMQKFALSFVILSEGLPILHAGMEFMRTKEIPRDMLDGGACFDDAARIEDGRAFLRNSYNACDRINALDWSRCAEKQDVVAYARDLIALRKAHPAFRIADGAALAGALTFIDSGEAGLPAEILAWRIDGKKCGDEWNMLLLLANPLAAAVPFCLPESGEWRLITDGIRFAPHGGKTLQGGSEVTLAAKTVAVYANGEK